MADSVIVGNWRRDDHRLDVAGVAHLSRRHAHDGKEGDDSGSLALGSTGVTHFRFLILDLRFLTVISRQSVALKFAPQVQVSIQNLKI